MGVPRFYRWVSERYPLINQIVWEPASKTEIDNFYVDLNGVFHNATHGDTVDLSKPLDFDAATLATFRMLDELVRVAKPLKLLYIAVDGVAPRAKMNQQRVRRFRNARDESTAAFDSNAITPGTEFMEKMSSHIKFFIAKKMTEDPLWMNLDVVLSGVEVPGEGEHKILSCIREAEMAKTTRHCIYGLDADLVFLSLASRETYVTLLREEVVFGWKRNGENTRGVLIKPQNFQMLQIGILKEYVELEMRQELPFDFNVARVIDDFVFLCMLVGNDFIPGLPSIDIREGGLDALLALYRKLLPAMGGYLVETDRKSLSVTRLSLLLKHLSSHENDVLTLRARVERRRSRNIAVKSTIASEDADGDPISKKSIDGLETEIGVEELDEDLVDSKAAEVLRSTYYSTRAFSKDMSQQSNLKQVCSDYLQTLLWTLTYYNEGVSCWSWYYPHYYAPLASDLSVIISEQLINDIEFENGLPLRPLEQLLCVLPPTSQALVPEELRELVRSGDSPIMDFYPLDFVVDPNGSTNSWEGVPLIPFVDTGRLFKALKSVSDQSVFDISLNQSGSELLYRVSDESTTLVESTLSVFNDITKCKVAVSDFVASQYSTPKVTGEFEWPSLLAINTTYELGLHQINLFDKASAKDSVIIRIENRECDACTLVGKLVYLWPYMEVVEIQTISTPQKSISTHGEYNYSTTETARWEVEYAKALGSLMNRGISVTEQTAIAGVRSPHSSHVFSIPVPMLISKTIPFVPQNLPSSQLSSGEVVLLSNGRGTVIRSEGDQVLVQTHPEFTGNLVEHLRLHYDPRKWYDHNDAAKMALIKPRTLAMVTSTIAIRPGNANLGLSFKHPKESLVAAGLVKEVGVSRGGDRWAWKYSDVAVAMVVNYTEKFPLLFELLDACKDKSVDVRTLLLAEMDRAPATEYIEDAGRYIASLSQSAAPFIHFSSEVMCADRVKTLSEAVLTENTLPSIEQMVPIDSVYRAGSNVPSDKEFALGDRVLFLHGEFGIPFGSAGTVVGQHPHVGYVDVVWDNVLLCGYDMYGICPASRGVSLPKLSLLNMSTAAMAEAVEDGWAVKKPTKKKGRRKQ